MPKIPIAIPEGFPGLGIVGEGGFIPVGTGWVMVGTNVGVAVGAGLAPGVVVGAVVGDHAHRGARLVEAADAPLALGELHAPALGHPEICPLSDHSRAQFSARDAQGIVCLVARLRIRF